MFWRDRQVLWNRHAFTNRVCNRAVGIESNALSSLENANAFVLLLKMHSCGTAARKLHVRIWDELGRLRFFKAENGADLLHVVERALHEIACFHGCAGGRHDRWVSALHVKGQD